MRLVIADCAVDYSGRLSAHLPMARRLIMIKADGSVSVHADDRAYKPLNWMSPPCVIEVCPGDGEGVTQVWQVRGGGSDTLRIAIGQVYVDIQDELGPDPGLVKDGVEAHLQALLADNPSVFGDGYRLVRREHPTPIGPVDLLLHGPDGYAIVEVKRRGDIDGVEQLTRYLELVRRDPLLGHVDGILAAQVIKPQARTLAVDRGIACVVVDYDGLRGVDHPEDRLF